MTAKEFTKQRGLYESIIPFSEVIRLMEEYARLMCDKQKELCAVYADTTVVTLHNTVDLNSILNTPYPEELL